VFTSSQPCHISFFARLLLEIIIDMNHLLWQRSQESVILISSRSLHNESARSWPN
jgi:hypothetical protein